ncbi:MAG: hypothetical protein KC777_15375 [Cyanobacteria bacterium HKST-UBA02]|nr:hypothetical protein [Cyanobacteria bacterium HKST-UBA02]
MKPAWYMKFQERDDCLLDKTGGLPTHLPRVVPRNGAGEEMAFIAQFYCMDGRLAIPDTLCVQLYQDPDGDPLPVAVRLPVDAPENQNGQGLAHPQVKRLAIDWTVKQDPDNIPDVVGLTDEEGELMESKIAGTPYYTDDELPEGHTYLFQLAEEPAGLNFADRIAIVTMDETGDLYVRLQ